MQNPSTFQTPLQPIPTATSPATSASAPDNVQKIERVQSLLRSSYMLADDEGVPVLTWRERDEIARQIHEAINLLREVHPTTPRVN